MGTTTGSDRSGTVSRRPTRRIGELPSALERLDRLVERVGRGPVALFLDYDGTLTPIVDDPKEAVLAPETRRAIEELRDRCPVAIVSGRDLDEVREMVGIDDIHYAGSHGFDILEPDGTHHVRGRRYLPALQRSADTMQRRLDGIRGAWVERKRFAVAVHFRTLEDADDDDRIESVVDEVVGQEPTLQKIAGKKIFELRPALEWDKGRTISWMLERLSPEDPLPVYVGDDVTDEDAFRALGQKGIGVVVEGEVDRETTADYSLSGPDAVRGFLRALVDVLTESATARRNGSSARSR